MTAVLDIILIAVLLADIIVHALRWRAERAAVQAAQDWPPYAEPPQYDDGPDDPADRVR